MGLAKYIKAGNKFFERKLSDYKLLGLSYSEFWDKAYDDFIRHQVGKGKTDQGFQHCKDVENNIWLLIDKSARFFPKEALYVLSLSCALHDCAKTGSETDHGLEGASMIKHKLVSMGYVQQQATADALSFIVMAHTSGVFSQIPDRYHVGGDVELYLKGIAAIFRLADMMSTSEERSARYHQMLSTIHGDKSEFVNSVRLKIQSCKPSRSDRTCIEISAYYDDIQTKRDVKAYVQGLNEDLTSEHKQILQNAKTSYLTKNQVLKEKDVTLPYKFVLSWLTSFLDTLSPDSKPRTVARRDAKLIKRIGRLIPCYFYNKETNIDIYKHLINSVDKGVVDSKYLYWSFTGTKQYLSLCRNPNYDLPNIGHNLLASIFKKELYPVIENTGKKIECLIDLGAGNGQEANIILSHLILRNVGMLKIYLVDFSYHMLRVAVNTIEEENIENDGHLKNIQLIAVNGDIRDLSLYETLLKTSCDCRLFCFLGGTLGNYLERDVLEPIKRQMSTEDFFLLGIDLIGNRSDQELLSAYDSIYNRKFLFNPLADIGYNFGQCNFKCHIRDMVSEVPNSKTIVSSFTRNKEIQMAISTKYDIESTIQYLKKQFKFRVAKKIVNEAGNYAILLLTK